MKTVEKKTVLLEELWSGTNEIRQVVMKVYRSMDDNKSFKQFSNLKTTKQLINDTAKRYIEKAKEGLNVEFVKAYVKGDQLFIEIKSDEKYIANALSFKCSTALGFVDASHKLNYAI